MVRPFDSEMEYTDSKMVQLQCLQEKKFHCCTCSFFCLGNPWGSGKQNQLFPTGAGIKCMILNTTKRSKTIWDCGKIPHLHIVQKSLIKL